MKVCLPKKKNDIKSTWKILNCVINRTMHEPIRITSMQENGLTVTDSEEIANMFCQYFANIGPNLASKITQVSKPFNENLIPVSTSSLPNFNKALVRWFPKLLDRTACPWLSLRRPLNTSANHCYMLLTSP